MTSVWRMLCCSAEITIATLCSVGCVGEAAVGYKGSVTAASGSNYSFDDAANPSGGTPIVGASVVLRTGASGPCSQNVDELSRAPNVKHTDSSGEFDNLFMTFPGMIGKDTEIVVCVDHPQYEHLEYRTIYESSPDPKHGEQWLNIRLKKRN